MLLLIVIIISQPPPRFVFFSFTILIRDNCAILPTQLADELDWALLLYMHATYSLHASPTLALLSGFVVAVASVKYILVIAYKRVISGTERHLFIKISFSTLKQVIVARTPPDAHPPVRYNNYNNNKYSILTHRN